MLKRLASGLRRRLRSGVEAMEAGTDAIQRTSQAGSEQRLGGAYRWESPWPPENRELAGSDHIALPKAYFDSLGLPATVVRS
jgi:hypothetical protein